MQERHKDPVLVFHSRQTSPILQMKKGPEEMKLV